MGSKSKQTQVTTFPEPTQAERELQRRALERVRLQDLLFPDLARLLGFEPLTEQTFREEPIFRTETTLGGGFLGPSIATEANLRRLPFGGAFLGGPTTRRVQTGTRQVPTGQRVTGFTMLPEPSPQFLVAPETLGLVNQAFDPFTQRALEQFRLLAEDAASTRGLRLTDTPIGEPFLRESGQFLNQVEALKAQQALALQQFQTQQLEAAKQNRMTNLQRLLFGIPPSLAASESLAQQRLSQPTTAATGTTSDPLGTISQLLGAAGTAAFAAGPLGLGLFGGSRGGTSAFPASILTPRPLERLI